MITQEVVQQALDDLSLLKFSPAESARPALIRLLLAMCSSDKQIQWLVKRVTVLYDEWPGPHELRAVMCSRFKPKDGIEADSRHPKYVEEGIPSEHPELSAPTVLLIEGNVQKPQPKIAETTLAVMEMAMNANLSEMVSDLTEEEIKKSRDFFESRGVLGL